MNQTTLYCPGCEGQNITSCPGGTCLKPGEWERQNIKYICMDCLCEFGDPESEAPGLLWGKTSDGTVITIYPNTIHITPDGILESTCVARSLWPEYKSVIDHLLEQVTGAKDFRPPKEDIDQ